jgi:hypothetical protein
LFFTLWLRTIIFAAPIREGAVAQSVEQRTENPCVGGSIPPHTTERLWLVMTGAFYFFYQIIDLVFVYNQMRFPSMTEKD